MRAACHRRRGTRASVWSWIAALDLFPLRCRIYKSHEVVEVTTPSNIACAVKSRVTTCSIPATQPA